jgi:hypothetical protein
VTVVLLREHFRLRMKEAEGRIMTETLFVQEPALLGPEWLAANAATRCMAMNKRIMTILFGAFGTPEEMMSGRLLWCILDDEQAITQFSGNLLEIDLITNAVVRRGMTVYRP